MSMFLSCMFISHTARVFISINQSGNKMLNIVSVHIPVYIYLRRQVEFHIHGKTFAWNVAENLKCNVAKYGNEYKKNKQKTTINLDFGFFYVLQSCQTRRRENETLDAPAHWNDPASPAWSEAKVGEEALDPQNDAFLHLWMRRGFYSTPSRSLMVGNHRCLGDTRTRVTVITSVSQAVWGTVLHSFQQFEGVFFGWFFNLILKFMTAVSNDLWRSLISSFWEVDPSSFWLNCSFTLARTGLSDDLKRFQ